MHHFFHTIATLSQSPRSIVPGGFYFFTQVTHQRLSWLCKDLARKTLNQAIASLSKQVSF